MSRAKARNATSATVFSALGCTTRLQLVDRLSDGREHSIIQLTDGFGLSRQAVTKHLQVLERAGIVRSKRLGRESRFSIQPKRIQSAKSYLERISAQWDEAIERLRSSVEE